MIIGLVVAVLVTGAGVAALRIFFAPAHDDAIELVPADAVLYANFFLNPSTNQKMALEDLLAKFPQAGTFDQAKGFLAEQIDAALEFAGIDARFESDVEPWLGHQIAFFLREPSIDGAEPDGAVLVATDDAGASQDFLDRVAKSDEFDFEERSYGGIAYLFERNSERAAGVVGDFLVLGNEKGFRAVVDAPDGETLADSDRYRDAVRGLAQDRVALLYANLEPIKDQLDVEAELPPAVADDFLSVLDQPLVASLFLRSDAIVLESSSAAPDGALAALTNLATEQGNLQDLPIDAWGAFTIPKVGQNLASLFDSLTSIGFPGLSRLAVVESIRAQTGIDIVEDVMSWPGDLGAFVQGTSMSSLGGGVVIESRDADASRRSLARFQLLLRRQRAPVLPLDLKDFGGFAIQDAAMPQPVNFIDAGGRVVITYGEQATLDALDTGPKLGSTSRFDEASALLTGGYSMGFFLDMGLVVRLLDSVAPPEDAGYHEVRPFLEPLGFVVSGTKRDDDLIVQRIVIGVP